MAATRNYYEILLDFLDLKDGRIITLTCIMQEYKDGLCHH
jgi:hypothetical protein